MFYLFLLSINLNYLIKVVERPNAYYSYYCKNVKSIMIIYVEKGN